jgi:two-component system, cell cycle sensor histidine kinase and response regulator CckA
MSSAGNILIIDDDPGTCQTIGDILELHGYAVQTAAAGGEALAALAQGSVDAAILDIQLPDVPGLELMRTIKTSHPGLEVIVITGHASISNAVQALNGAAFAYLTKPFDTEHLMVVVDKALEKKRLERALRESEERYRLVAEHIQDVILLVDLEGRMAFVNRRGEELTGYTAAEVRDRPLASLLSPEGGAAAEARIRAACSGHDVDPFFETELVRRDGSRVWIEANVANVHKDGQLVGRLAVMRDISSRRHTEAALRETSQTLRTLIDASPVAIMSLDLGGRVTLWNRSAERMFGWSHQEILGQSLPTVPEDKRAEFEAAIAQNRRGEASVYETQRKRKDGSLVNVLTSTAAILDSEGRVAATMAIIVDVTEQKQLEEQLRQAVKMEGIGRLAGGIAHDFNNLLTVIAGRIYLLMSQLPAGHAMRPDLQLIEQTGERAATLTKQLLAFSRKQILAPIVLDLNNVVTSMKQLLERALGEDIDLIIDLDPSLGRVLADQGQLEQVILNLAVNARDAMPDGGQLVLETSNVEVDETYLRQHVDLRPGSYVALAVTDNGIGMAAETLARLFEPFFTTKEVGRGTGLGLATAYGIVRQSNGHITVYSEPGHGTTFRVYLPKAEGNVAATVAVETSTPSGTETVLLVEDDLNLRTLAHAILQQQGYIVLEAEDAADAIRIADQYAGSVHLLITDVVMPKMNGPTMARAIQEHRPDAKVLYMSGYTDDAIVRHGVLEPGTPFLQKPFTPGTLVRKIRQVLDQAR